MRRCGGCGSSAPIPSIAAAVARGELSEAWAAEIADWTRKLPADWRDDVDRLLADTALAGAELADLAVVAQAAYEKWRQQQGPDDDGDDDGGFGDRYLKLATTIDGAGRVNGDLTAECAAPLQAVLEALGKKAGPDDDRTEAQRFHDALQLACQLLLRAGWSPTGPAPTPASTASSPCRAAAPAGRAEAAGRLARGPGGPAGLPGGQGRRGRRLRRGHQPPSSPATPT